MRLPSSADTFDPLRSLVSIGLSPTRSWKLGACALPPNKVHLAALLTRGISERLERSTSSLAACPSPSPVFSISCNGCDAANMIACQDDEQLLYHMTLDWPRLTAFGFGRNVVDVPTDLLLMATAAAAKEQSLMIRQPTNLRWKRSHLSGRKQTKPKPPGIRSDFKQIFDNCCDDNADDTADD